MWRRPQRPAGRRRCTQSGDNVPVKRRKPKARITGYPDWQVEFLESGVLPANADGALNEFELIDWEYVVDQKICPVRDAWTACREKIMADWTDKHARPYGWWIFDSGLERKIGPMRLTKNIVAKRMLYSWRDSIPDDQQAWLVEHGY
jgi:hypothetical protein